VCDKTIDTAPEDGTIVLQRVMSMSGLKTFYIVVCD